jgi:ubiquinone/menaquinone biosynthesis C-methylase UbiE
MRVLEKEVMESAEEAKAYDELDRLWGDVLFQGFAESALRMGLIEGRVLDVGCGPGRISTRLAKLNPKFSIEGIDLSQNMLDLAVQTAAINGMSQNTRFSVGDAKKIPFPDETFDLVICHNFLHQLPEPLVALKEINRVAKRNGAILIRDVQRLAEPWMSAMLPLFCLGQGTILKRLTIDSYRAGLTRTELADLAKAAGIEAQVRPYFLTHVGIERLATPYKPYYGQNGQKPWNSSRLLKSLYVTTSHR